jgi:hypothetical protein
MAIRQSDALTYLSAGDVGIRRALANAHLTFFTGQQPLSANTGYLTNGSQPIISFTLDDLIYAPTVDHVWKATFSAYTAGPTSIVSVNIDGINLLSGPVSFGQTIAEGCSLLANAITVNPHNGGYTATATATEIFVKAPFGTGALTSAGVLGIASDGLGVLTITINGTSTAGVSGVNGFIFNLPIDNGATVDLVKVSTETWKGRNGYGPATSGRDIQFDGIQNGQTYTAGWCRFCSSAGDNGAADTSGINGFIRLDLSVGAVGSDVTMTPAPTFLVNTVTPVETPINNFTIRIKKNKG